MVECVYGEWFDEVRLNGNPLDPLPSQAVFNHSPDGFAWGFGGSGPAQLALAILLAVTGDEERSVRLHQDFKREFIEPLPQADASFTVDVEQWASQAEARRA